MNRHVAALHENIAAILDMVAERDRSHAQTILNAIVANAQAVQREQIATVYEQGKRLG